MAGLEVLYTLVQSGISCGQDAVLVLTHWEMVKHGWRCLGSGDQASGDDRKSELLPAGWNSNKEVYTLRYRGDDGSLHVLKAVTVDSSLLFNLMNTSTQQVTELTVVISDHINEDQLHCFDRVYKDSRALSEAVRRQLVSPVERTGSGRRKDRKSKTERQEEEGPDDDGDPLRVPTRQPRAGTLPHWSDPMVPPFAAGGADLDPFGMRGGGGMIVDPLRSGYPRAPSGIPDILPPGAVPPGARFDPFGPPGRHRPGPDPDHLPPPGYDDMYM